MKTIGPVALSFALFFGLISAHAAPPVHERKLYVGTNSTEAIMSFNYKVEYASQTPPGLGRAQRKIEKQLTHLFGPMGVAEYTAVPKGDHRLTNIQTALKPGTSNVYVSTYSYKGVIVLKNGPTTSYSVVLPINPDRVYKAGMVGEENPCTDPHYQSEGDFWYFWNPSNPGCPLKEGRDYGRVQTAIKRVANTDRTYPEYERLKDDKGVIRVSLLMGMDDPSKGKDPNTSKDINADNFREVRELLRASGFAARKLLGTEISAITKGLGASQLPYVEELSKKTPKATIKVLMFFGPSGIDEESGAFHYFFKDAVENSAVMVYDGHSGLGGHLDLPSIEQTESFTITPNQNRYQIYFFNSCSSYTYYNTMFFDRKVSAADKRGTKNLDIMTNGLATYFSTISNSTATLVLAIDAWASDKATMSYQQIAKDADSDNLFGVNGDEDNPTSPN